MTPLSRRTVLRGIGTAIALPALEAMLPKGALGATVAAAPPGPKRLAWLYIPNGVDMSSWKPATVGADYALTPTLQPLAALKDKFMVISGLACTKANPNGDGPGDHARAMCAYLTGVQPRKSEGANIHLGISADQAAADKIGVATRFPSLELGLEEGSQAGRCDSGYSCAYLHNLSWRNDTTPMVKDCIPQSVFDRMFSNGDPNESAEAKARRQERRKSVLDFALSDAKSLQGRLGSTDKRKVDEYLSSVREIELRLTKAAAEPEVKPPAGTVRPEAIDLHGGTKKLGVSTSSSNYDKHLPLMIDMMILAFQTDLTRVITLPFADEESNQVYPWADAPVPHHGTSHHMGDPAKIALLAKINLYHMKHVAYLLQKLDSIKEGNGSVLDNSLIAYGSGNSDGQRHNHDNLPTLLFGKGGGTVRTGRHIQVDPNTPINNLWLSMLEHAGAPRASLGDSTGKLSLT
jgi:hypothetical protein